jgi:phosphoglycerate dehydrogenase-like enzyme
VSVRVLSTMDFPASWLEEVAALSPRLAVEQIPARAADELPPDALADVEVLYTGSAFPEPEQAPNLRWVQLDTSGADHVRRTWLWEAPDVAITSIAGVSPRPMAEYVMAMVLSFAHRLEIAARMRAQRHWPGERERWTLYDPLHLPGSRMTIVGYGRIGRRIAQAASGFGIEVAGVCRSGARTYEADVPDVHVVGVEALDEALAGTDWLVVCVPGTPETMGLIGPAQLAALNASAHLIDVARGGVVDEEALLAALDAGALAGAALDVFAEEPLPADSPWWDHPRVIVTPHISGLASDYPERVLALFKDNVTRYLAGRPLLNVVDRQLGY